VNAPRSTGRVPADYEISHGPAADPAHRSHPRNADYRTETTSKYEINSVSAGRFETGQRAGAAGVLRDMDRFPRLKVITIISAESSPISKGGRTPAGTVWRRARRTKITASLLKRLKKRPLDYSRRSHGDTACRRRAPRSAEFHSHARPGGFRIGRPFDPKRSKGYIRATIGVVEARSQARDR